MKEKDESLKNATVGDWVTKGNVTEQAILNFFKEKYGGQQCVEHKKLLKDIQLEVIAFTSARKKASIIVKTENGARMYTKGGPDFLGNAVTKIVGVDGNTYDIEGEVPCDPELGEGLTGREIIDKTVN